MPRAACGGPGQPVFRRASGGPVRPPRPAAALIRSSCWPPGRHRARQLAFGVYAVGAACASLPGLLAEFDHTSRRSDSLRRRRRAYRDRRDRWSRQRRFPSPGSSLPTMWSPTAMPPSSYPASLRAAALAISTRGPSPALEPRCPPISTPLCRGGQAASCPVHHNVFFFRRLGAVAGASCPGPPSDPTVYLCNSDTAPPVSAGSA